MVSVLALNKLELKDMINSEMIENPVLEELEESAASIDERTGIEGDRERSVEAVETEKAREEKDPFDEVDFGSYFQDYLDPGFKTASNFEEYDKPSFEHFLSQPSTLTDHLMWQLGSLNLSHEVETAAELIVGNLDENGYLTASDAEMAQTLTPALKSAARPEPIPFDRALRQRGARGWDVAAAPEESSTGKNVLRSSPELEARMEASLHAVVQARELIQQLDPAGVAARDLRECLLLQITAQRRRASLQNVRSMEGREEEPEASEESEYGAVKAASRAPVRLTECDGVLNTAAQIVGSHLALLQKKDMRELTKSCARSPEEVQAAVNFIRTLDPRPGQRYNVAETRLIEPDVAFVKRDDAYVVLMNEEDMPTLRLSGSYRRMLREKGTEKDVREYVKERYKSAIQLLRNIEQRKNTIVRTCEAIVRRQSEFLERGEQALKPMMIKEVAEEIGVHPSTVSRAVANKYVHTSQGVYELRFFFSEGVNGPEGGDLPLVLLKRKVKKLIGEEDPRKPLTDDHLAAALKAQGINVTRRTVAKYREDMQIPSTHQRRVR